MPHRMKLGKNFCKITTSALYIMLNAFPNFKTIHEPEHLTIVCLSNLTSVMRKIRNVEQMT